MNPSADTDFVAVKLGSYRLLAELGRGGMAKVFLAASGGISRVPQGQSQSAARAGRDLGKLVVIKQILPHLAEDPAFTSMFLDEARLAARLSHPNVVQTHDVGEVDGRYFMVMEYLSGQSLSRVRHRLWHRRALPLGLHLRVLVEVLNGLHHAHELCDYDGHPLGVVHRDVSPENVFVTYDGAVKVVDFGIAKACDSINTTQAGVVKGKISYMAPEQARGEKLDRRADVFAVGVMLWEAATGRRMWNGAPPTTIMQHLFVDDIPPARSAREDLPEALEEIINKATAPKRDERYATAAEMATALERLLDESGAPSSPRALGHLVAEHFAEERARLSHVVDEQLRAAASRPATDPPIASLSAGQGPSLPAHHHTTTARVAQIDRTVPSAVAPEAFARSVATHAPRPVRGFAMGAFGALLALAAAGGAFVSTRSMPGAAHASAPAASPAPPAAPTAPAARTVKLSVTAKPASAKIFLDGAPLPQNPYAGEMVPDTVTHVLRVEAPGHVPRVELFELNRDRVVEITLDAAPQPADPRAAEAPSASPSQPAGRAARGRRLDAANPYLR